MPDDQMDNRPPYLSFTTLLNFMDRWADGPMPPRIDKSALDRYSGSSQAMLLSTLRLIGYIDDEGVVQDSLREAVKDEAARKAYLEEWARTFYKDQIALAERGATAQMLQESFAEYRYTGSTLRKAIVFYLALVEYLGLPNSPLFRPPKQSATSTSRRRGPRKSRTVEPEAGPPPAARPGPRGDTTTIRIGDLATVTITVDAHWMRLPVETITTMREAIGQLEALGTTGADD